MKLALVLGLALVPAAAAAPPVPTSVQRAIVKTVPARFRYVPTQVPSGFEYGGWQGSRYGLDPYFGRNGGLLPLGFHALAQAPYGGRCSAKGSATTFRFGAIRVYFNGTHTDQDYWRCVRNGSVTLSASAFPDTASRRAIAAMVASARPLG